MEVATARMPVIEGRSAFDPKLWILVAGRFVTSCGHSISFPFFAIYVHLTLGVPMTIVGAIIFASGLVGAFSKMLGGMLADRVGRKRVMVVALALRSVAICALGLLALRPDPAWPAIAILFICSTANGFAFDSACHAMVADLADPRRRIYGYSLMRIGGNLGWGIGAIFGGLLGAFGFAAMFFTTAGVTALACGFLVVLARESLRAAPREGKGPPVPVLDCFRVPGFLGLCAGALLISVVMAQLIAPLSVYAKSDLGLTVRSTGMLFTINGLLIALLQFPAARLISRMRLSTALVGGSLLYAVGFALVGKAWGFWSAAACVVVVTAGELFVAPSVISLPANLAPADRRGRYLGVYGFFEMLGRCLGPLLGGVMLDAFAGRAWIHWAAVAGIALAAAACFGTLRRRVRADADRDITLRPTSSPPVPEGAKP